MFSDRIRGFPLRRVIKKVDSDLVHGRELQRGGYVTIRALADKSITTRFIATHYGSDIWWFQEFHKHKAKIERVLRRAKLCSAGCQRHYLLSGKLGFGGTDLPLGPDAGASS